MSRMRRSRPGGIARQAFILFVALILTGLLAWVFARSLRGVVHAAGADEILLEGFELFLAMLLLGTLSLVLLGVLLQWLLPREYGHGAFGEARLHEVYDAWTLRSFPLESDRDHARNPYRALPDLELCDVADQIDREAYPDTWTDVAHEIKSRVEAKDPLRIG